MIIDGVIQFYIFDFFFSLVFCKLLPSVVLKSQTIIMEFLFLLSNLAVCFMYFEVVLFDAFTFRIPLSFDELSLWQYVTAFFVPNNVL